MKKLLIISLLAFSAATATAADQCKATTKAGKQCARKAKETGYCAQHNPAAIRCAGTTKAGTPCKLLPSKGGQYCHLHKK